MIDRIHNAYFWFRSIIFRVWLALLESLQGKLIEMNLEQCLGYLHSLHKEPDRILEDEAMLEIPLDLLDKAIVSSPITESDINSLEAEFNILYQKERTK